MEPGDWDLLKKEIYSEDRILIEETYEKQKIFDYAARRRISLDQAEKRLSRDGEIFRGLRSFIETEAFTQDYDIIEGSLSPPLLQFYGLISKDLKEEFEKERTAQIIFPNIRIYGAEFIDGLKRFNTFQYLDKHFQKKKHDFVLRYFHLSQDANPVFCFGYEDAVK